jgi:uncharacterized membrane protein
VVSDLTELGVFHVMLSVIALIAGLVCLIQDKAITLDRMAGSNYVWATILVCLTGLGIFAHGGFGRAHALSLLTLATLAVAWFASRWKMFGRRSRYVEIVAYSATYLFHLIRATTEISTRLPTSHPVFGSRDAPGLQAVIAVYLMLFLLVATTQVIRLRAERREAILR